MLELSLLQTTPTYIIAGSLFVLITLAYWIGHKSRVKRLKRHPDHEKSEVKTINGMLIGLLGLLLAFTFSMANSRFDERRHLVTEEANIIGTTILRTDLYPDSVRSVLRAALREYVERRIAFYQAGTNYEKAKSEFLAGQENSAKVWRIAADYARTDHFVARTSQMIPTINEMMDITSTRLAAGQGTIPDSIMYFLFFLCICTSFLLGYDQVTVMDWPIIAGYSLILSATVFSIIDLDRPRSGLINMDGPNKSIIELRQMFVE